MLSDDTRQKIENIIAGNVIPGKTDHCTTIRNILCTSFTASRALKKDFESKQRVKEEQATFLKQYAEQHNFLINNPDAGSQIAKGGEARVYFSEDKRTVLKANDCGYYATWLEYFDSVLLHNAIFFNTAYELMGFTVMANQVNDIALHAVVKQPYIVSDRLVELQEIKTFLEYNGFQNTRRNDYAHTLFGLILEDMHDENVLVQQDTLFFIDTVFYVSISNG
jgi:hypothetical protein